MDRSALVDRISTASTSLPPLLSNISAENINEGSDLTSESKTFSSLVSSVFFPAETSDPASNLEIAADAGLLHRKIAWASTESTHTGALFPEAGVAEIPRHSQASDDTSRSALKDVTFGSVELLSPWFPKIIENEDVAVTFRTRRKRRIVVLWACFALTFGICITNFTLTVIAWSALPISPDGVITIYKGDCYSTTRFDTGLHVLINLLSTLLLSASNLALQLVVSPTRHDVDSAHAKGIWLDIGVPSFRNLLHISCSSVIIWGVLVLSSLPIHFM